MIKGNPEINFNLFSEPVMAMYYLGINNLPCLIHSPFRKDEHKSFYLYCKDNIHVKYVDFATGEWGSIWEILKNLYNKTWKDLYRMIYNDMLKIDSEQTNAIMIKDRLPGPNYYQGKQIKVRSEIDIKVTLREWREYDEKYWESYGVPFKYVKMADIHPVAYKTVIKDGVEVLRKAPKYCYAFFEFKEGKTTVKIYQPYDTYYKWISTHDKSVISLWTKVPEKGKNVCICSSLKDALCLWANIGIPSLAVQGEGYTISDTAIKELKKRFKNIFICFDCDAPGLRMGKKLAEHTGFINVVMKRWGNCKDISDFYKYCNEQKHDLDIFKSNMIKIFKEAVNNKNLSNENDEKTTV